MSQDLEKPAPPDPAPDRRRQVGSKGTPEVEAAIGARIRALRTAAGMSQTALGQAVGVSFQQVQKYESGRDRVSASTLIGLATALNVSPRSFYEGDELVPTVSGADVGIEMKAFTAFEQIGDARVQRQLVDLAKLLGTDAGGGTRVRLRHGKR